MSQVLLVQAWDADEFHRRVRELDQQGWRARRESYRITADVNPETGEVRHLYAIEMQREDTGP